ncbi:unnamed protein product [Nesidiocoris tenuis]|nr:unnamed protein product [Nesidiocoris tenuis]
MSKATRSTWRCFECRSAPKDSDLLTCPDANPSQNEAFLKSIFDKMGEQIASTIRRELNPFKEEMKEKLSLMQSSLDSCLEQYSSLSSELSGIRHDLESIKNENLQARVKLLEEKIAELPVAGRFDAELILSEVEERRRRSSNVLFFKVPESGSNVPSESTAHDLGCVKGFLDTLSPGLSGHAQRGFRLGKRSPDNVRPLKVVF